MTELTDQQFVKQKYPDAEIIGLPHGKVAVWYPSTASDGPLGYIGDIKYLGTRGQRKIDAWQDAAERIRRSENK